MINIEFPSTEILPKDQGSLVRGGKCLVTFDYNWSDQWEMDSSNNYPSQTAASDLSVSNFSFEGRVTISFPSGEKPGGR